MATDEERRPRFRKRNRPADQAFPTDEEIQRLPGIEELRRLSSVSLLPPKEELLGIKAEREAVQAFLRVAELERAGRSTAPAEDPSRLFKVLKEDYSTIEYKDRRHELRPMAAAAVKVLHKAWKAGNPDMFQRDVCRAIKSINTKLYDAFRENLELWNTLVIKGERLGTRRLNLPDPNPSA